MRRGPFFLAAAIAVVAACATYDTVDPDKPTAVLDAGAGDASFEAPPDASSPSPAASDASTDAPSCLLPPARCGGKVEWLDLAAEPSQTAPGVLLATSTDACPGAMRIRAPPTAGDGAFAYVEQALPSLTTAFRIHQVVAGLRASGPLAASSPIAAFGCGIFNGTPTSGAVFEARLELSADGKLEIDGQNSFDSVAPVFPTNPAGVDLGAAAPNGEPHTFDLAFSVVASGGAPNPVLRVEASVDGGPMRALEISFSEALKTAKLRCGLFESKPGSTSYELAFSDTAIEICAP